jgi:NAD(P)-dependent dehydrogenase (short-subunit alcohol dehydrogenase family)
VITGEGGPAGQAMTVVISGASVTGTATCSLPLPGATGGRDNEQRFAESNELCGLGLGMNFRSGAVRVCPVDSWPSGHGQARHFRNVLAERVGRLDVLINNAGISGRTEARAQDPTTLDLGVMRVALETNVFGVVQVSNAMLPLLRRATSARCEHIQQHGFPDPANRSDPAAYASSKPMLNSITTQYARAFNDTNIITNAACPGYVATDFTGLNSPRTTDQGAVIALHLATLPDDGPRGGFFDDDGAVPW